MSRIAVYWHTLRHLKSTQIAARVWFRLHRPGVDLRRAPRRRAATAEFCAPIAAEKSLVAPLRFSFLGEERELPAHGGWDDAGVAKLWRYNLHYFQDLNAHDADSRRSWHTDLLGRWIAENTAGVGTGWEPYPTSLRIVNWIKWALRGNVWDASVESSLAAQVRWLLKRLEYHLLGNHLFANAKALLYAGLFFEGSEAERWLAVGRRIIDRQLREQVLPDGGHFERSPMYHGLFLEDLLDIVNLLHTFGCDVPASWRATVTPMQRWLEVMTHPDGEISFFNDAAMGVAPTHGQLRSYARRLQLDVPGASLGELTVLAASGYARLAAGSVSLFCDCAAVGPDYIPGHAHADTLSFELSLRSQRVLVNSGTSEYGLGLERQRQRGSAAHNTLVVDGENSSEVWAGFRVARRARARLRVRSAALPVSIEGSHDGYLRLEGGNEHTRVWTLLPDSLTIEDHISGTFRSAVAYFHLHPAVAVKKMAPRQFALCVAGDSQLLVTFSGCSRIELESGTWHPRFGTSIHSVFIAVHLDAPTLSTRVSWPELK